MDAVHYSMGDVGGANCSMGHEAELTVVWAELTVVWAELTVSMSDMGGANHSVKKANWNIFSFS